MVDGAPLILVIEDEPPLQKLLRVTLEGQNYRVLDAPKGEQGLRHAAMSQPDLVILDLGLPDLDGLEVTKRLREWSGVPIIVVSARGKEQDKVAALDAGADDYLTKPFAAGELLARVRVALRHTASAHPDTGQPIFAVGDLNVDLLRRRVSAGGREVHLTPIEFRLFDRTGEARGNGPDSPTAFERGLGSGVGRAEPLRPRLHEPTPPEVGSRPGSAEVPLDGTRGGVSTCERIVTVAPQWAVAAD